jgi:hypothetical protein
VGIEEHQANARGTNAAAKRSRKAKWQQRQGTPFDVYENKRRKFAESRRIAFYICENRSRPAGAGSTFKLEGPDHLGQKDGLGISHRNKIDGTLAATGVN